MQTVFIINPVAGQGKKQKAIGPQISSVMRQYGLPGEVYYTKGIGDARAFVRKYPIADTCFYGVSGDGTLNEIVHGVMERKEGAVGLVPCGTGNDFVRVFDDMEAFFDIERQIKGACVTLDLLKINDGYSLNLCNMGLDAQTAAGMVRYKKYLPGPMAYQLSLLQRILGPLGEDMRVTLDNGEVFEGKYLLVSACNGRAYGGGFFAAPRAELDDGWIEFSLVQVITRRQFLSLVKRYKAGLHLDDPDFAPVITYRRCRSLLLEMPTPSSFCNDGEISAETRIEISILPKALRFMVPAGVALLPPIGKEKDLA